MPKNKFKNKIANVDMAYVVRSGGERNMMEFRGSSRLLRTFAVRRKNQILKSSTERIKQSNEQQQTFKIK